MVSKDAIVAKELNAFITGFSFVDKSLEDHIYASLSQPPIRIINKNGSDNEMDFTVECPNCKKAVNLGKEIFMTSGHIYCINKGCRESLEARLEKK